MQGEQETGLRFRSRRPALLPEYRLQKKARKYRYQVEDPEQLEEEGAL